MCANDCAHSWTSDRIAVPKRFPNRGRHERRDVIAQADQDDGPFGDHLKRILISVTKFEPVERAMREALASGTISETDSFYRLSASGVVKKAEGGAVVPRCSLYKRYLSAHLK